MKQLFMVLAGSLLAVSALQAAVIYDNTSQPIVNTYGVQYDVYDSFSTGSSPGVLSGLKLVLADPAAPGGSFLVDLYSDNSSTVGALLTNLATISDSSLTASPQVVSVALAANPLLNANTRYWIGLTGAGSSSVWAYDADASGIGTAGEFYQFGATAFDNSSGPYLMQVSETVPEPCTFLFVGQALAALVVWRRRAAR